MERSEWPDDDALGSGAYPPAPLPPHERAWRHPSELGTATWSHVDPPLTLGRGLMITTGAIGGLLSLAVLWAMLPSPGRGGLASPAVVTSTSNGLTSLVGAARPDTLVASSVAARSTSTALAAVATTAPATVNSTRAPIQQPQQPHDTENVDGAQSMPVAVGVGDSMVITTARAAEGRTFITVTGADGKPHDVEVLIVDRDLGLAVLSPEAAAMTSSYGIGPAPAAGDAVTVLSAMPITANLQMDSGGHLTLDTWAESFPEGTPVVNADGLLVGMCSRGESGPVFVSVANLAALIPAAKRSLSGPYVGVHVIDSDRGGPLVDGLDPNGPAATAGIVAGDVITAVDGVAVATIDQLKTVIAAHAPTDVVTLTVIDADQTSRDVSVTLSTAPSM